MKQWFERLREMREKSGLKQKELAIRAGLSQGLVSGLERGKKDFTKHNLDQILGVLDKSYQDLFCEKTKEELELELQILKLRYENKDGDSQAETISGTQKPAGRTGLKKKAG